MMISYGPFDFRIATPYDDLHIAEQINLYENATGKFSSKQMFFSNSYYINFITTINTIIHAMAKIKILTLIK